MNKKGKSNKSLNKNINKTQWPIYNDINGDEQYAMPIIHQKDIFYKLKDKEEKAKNKDKISSPKGVPSLIKLRKENEKVNWGDLVKLHDYLREVASHRYKQKEKHIKQLHKEFLEAQIEENKQK